MKYFELRHRGRLLSINSREFRNHSPFISITAIYRNGMAVSVLRKAIFEETASVMFEAAVFSEID